MVVREYVAARSPMEDVYTRMCLRVFRHVLRLSPSILVGPEGHCHIAGVDEADSEEEDDYFA